MSHCYANSSFQDVSFKWDQMVVGKVGDICFCVLITHICFHWQKLCSILVPANKTKGTLHGRRFCVNSLHKAHRDFIRSEHCTSKDVAIEELCKVLFCMKYQEECVTLLLPTHTQGRKRCTNTLPVLYKGGQRVLALACKNGYPYKHAICAKFPHYNQDHGVILGNLRKGYKDWDRDTTISDCS